MVNSHPHSEYETIIGLIEKGRCPAKWRLLVRYLLSNYRHYQISTLEAAKMVDAYFPLDHAILDSYSRMTGKVK